MKLKLPSAGKIMPTSLRKIECPYCGVRHIPTRDGICPRCGKRYLLTNTPDADSQKLSDRIAKSLRTFGSEAAAVLHHTSSDQKKIIAAIFACVAIAAVLFFAAIANLSGLESPVYHAPKRTYIPVIFRSGSRDYVLFHDGKTVELGIGNVLKYDCSSSGGIVYILYSGRITADTESARDGDYVVRIVGGKKADIVAKGEKGRVSYVAGGNCEHMYCIVPNTSEAENVVSGEAEQSPVSSGESQGEYLLWYAKGAHDRVLLSDKVTSTDLAVSPNGRYLLYSEIDSEGSQLMKYRISKRSAVGTGVKNSAPAVVGNKGKFFAYFKTDGEGKVHFSTVENTTEYVILPQNSELLEVISSSDMRTVALRFKNGIIFKSPGCDFKTVDFNTSSDFGFLRDEYINPVFSSAGYASEYSVLKGEMFPYFYYDSDGSTFYRVLEDGSKSPYFDVAADTAVVNDNGDIAFTSGMSLYISKLSGKASKKLAYENFSQSYSLIDISPNGKTLFVKDTSGRIYTLPTVGTDTAEAQFLTEDAAFIRSSGDSNALFYTKSNEAYLKRLSGTPRLTDSGIIPQYTCVFTQDFSQFVYAKDMGDDSSGNARHSLYIYRDGKPMFVADGLESVTVPNGERFIDTRTSHIFPLQSDDDSSGSLLINKAD